MKRGKGERERGKGNGKGVREWQRVIIIFIGRNENNGMGEYGETLDVPFGNPNILNTELDV